MKIFNIDAALKLPQTFNVMHDALDELYAKRQEDFQKDNPLKHIYKTVYLDKFQKSFGSSTGFKQAFEQTVDYASYPGFTSGDGFKTTISYKPFNGKILFTWQALLEGDTAGIAEEIANFQIAWQRQLVEYGIFALTAFFGGKVFDKVSKTWIKINSADTVDGDTMGDVKNPVFTNAHTVVRREGMSDAEFNALKQSNKFFINLKLDGTDIGAHAKLANGLHQIRVIMNKYYDDNGQRAGLKGRKKIVMTEDAHLNQAIESILAAENFSMATGQPVLNPVKGKFDIYTTAYLDGNFNQQIPMFAVNDGVGHAVGFMMLDPEYNNANKGPMMVERVGFSMKAVKSEDPEGVKYLGKQAFDFFCPSWRGVTYVMIGNPADIYNEGDKSTDWANPTTFTEIKPVANYGTINVANVVKMEEVKEPVEPEEPTEYTVTLTVGENGTATADKAKATPGSTVTLTVTPAEGYELDTITVGTTPLAAEVNTFVMPANNVTVNVTFKETV